MRGIVPARFAPILFGGLLSAIMVSIVSATVIIVNQGVTPDFLHRWLKSITTTWPIAFPTVLVVAPLVRRAVHYLTTPPAAEAKPGVSADSVSIGLSLMRRLPVVLSALLLLGAV
ncbi:MAG: DUF2798 domain-containing protein [Methylovulum sp.]|nr:DUF2798 domain-containing protein [Methylovulum sp.]